MPLPLRWFVLLVLVVGIPFFLGYFLVLPFAPGVALYVGAGLAVVFLLMTFVVAGLLPELYTRHYGAKKFAGSNYQTQLREYTKAATNAKIQAPPLYVINTSAPHALGVGFFPPQRRILFTQGLLETLEPDQLLAYLDVPVVMMARGETACLTLGAAAAYVWLLPLKIADVADNDSLRVILALIFGWIGAVYMQAIGLRGLCYQLDAMAGELHGRGGNLALGSALNAGTKILFKHPIGGLDYSSAPLFVVNPLGQSAVAAIFATHAPTPKRVKRLQRSGTRIVGKEAVAKSKGLI